MFWPFWSFWETAPLPLLGTAACRPWWGCSSPFETRQADQMPPREPIAVLNAKSAGTLAKGSAVKEKGPKMALEYASDALQDGRGSYAAYST